MRLGPVRVSRWGASSASPSTEWSVTWAEVRLRVNRHYNVALTRQLTDAFLTADSGLS